MLSPQSHAGMRPVIAIIGHRNAGKSSLLNQITGQSIAIVSDTPGTTTDAVSKSYELIPFGPVTFYDTAGLDDKGKLGNLRVNAAEKIIRRADLILYVIDTRNITNEIIEKLSQLKNDNLNFIPVFNFADIKKPTSQIKKLIADYHGISLSAQTGQGIEELKDRMVEQLKSHSKESPLLKDLVTKKDLIILVTPIDLAAPKGRLIMPQVQTIREALDANALTITTKTSELKNALAALKNPPALVVTDSQAVKEVAAIVPKDIPLTTFSMLFARSKGDFSQLLQGIKAVRNLKDNSRILIAEGCSHHITCDDIGRVKIPALLQKHTNKKLLIEFSSGMDFPDDLTPYDLIIHCGGCMLNRQEINRRLQQAKKQNINITNYGMVISLAQGVLDRTSKPLI